MTYINYKSPKYYKISSKDSLFRRISKIHGAICLRKPSSINISFRYQKSIIWIDLLNKRHMTISNKGPMIVTDK